MIRPFAMVAAFAACGGPHGGPNDLPRLPGDPPRAEEQAGSAGASCMPAGTYRVTMDLAPAKITQGDTGFVGSDTSWCHSMLAGAEQQLGSVVSIVRGPDGVRVEWPPGQAANATTNGDCELEISSPPMPTTLTFSRGTGTGSTTFTMGTQHEGDTCTATGAKLTFAYQPPAAPLPQPPLTIGELSFYMADKLSLKLHADGRVEVDNGQGWHPVGTLGADGKVTQDSGQVLGTLLPSGEFQTADGSLAAFRLDGVDLVVKNGDRFTIDAQGRIGGARDYQIRVEGVTDDGSKRAALFLMALMRGNQPY